MASTQNSSLTNLNVILTISIGDIETGPSVLHAISWNAKVNVAERVQNLAALAAYDRRGGSGSCLILIY